MLSEDDINTKLENKENNNPNPRTPVRMALRVKNVTPNKLAAARNELQEKNKDRKRPIKDCTDQVEWYDENGELIKEEDLKHKSPHKAVTTTPSKRTLVRETSFAVVTSEDKSQTWTFSKQMEQLAKDGEKNLAIKVRTVSIFSLKNQKRRATETSTVTTVIDQSCIEKVSKLPALNESKILIGPITLDLKSLENKMPRRKSKSQNNVMQGLSAKLVSSIYQALKENTNLKELNDQQLNDLAQQMDFDQKQWLHILGYEIGAGVTNTQTPENFVANSDHMNNQTKNPEEIISKILKRGDRESITFFITADLEPNPNPNSVFKGLYVPVAKSIDHYIECNNGYIHFHADSSVEQRRTVVPREVGLAFYRQYSSTTSAVTAAAASSTMVSGARTVNTSDIINASTPSDSSDGSSPLSVLSDDPHSHSSSSDDNKLSSESDSLSMDDSSEQDVRLISVGRRLKP